MAEEVGSAWVSITPSMRNFSKLLKADLKKSLAGIKDIEVPVKPVLDRKAFAGALLPGRQAIRVPVEVDRNSFRRSLLGLGRDSRSTIHETVKVDVDRESKRSLIRDLLGFGDSATRAATSAGTATGNTFTSAVGGVLTNPLTGLPAILTAAVATAVLGIPAVIVGSAATVAATLASAGLGGIFAGAFLLKDDPEIKKAAAGLFGGIKSTLVDAAKPLKGPFLDAIRILGDSFKSATPGIKDFFKGLAKSGAIQELARGLGGIFKSLSDTGALKKLGEAVGPVLKQLGMALPDIGNALSQFLISFAKAAPAAADFFGKFLRVTADVIRIVGGVVGWLARQFTTLWAGLKTAWQVIKDIGSGLKILWDAVVGAITANMAKVKPLKDLIVGIFTEIGKRIGLIPEKVTGLVNTVKGLPARIKTAVGDLGSLLLNSGKAVVQGLIDGIKAKLGDLGNMASNMAQIIWNYMMHSPAKEGPLSGRGNTFYSGQEVASQLAAGMGSRLPTVAGVAGQLASAAAFGGSASAAAAPGARLTIDTAGSHLDDLLVQVLQHSIRTRYGGRVEVALGSTGAHYVTRDELRHRMR